MMYVLHNAKAEIHIDKNRTGVTAPSIDFLVNYLN